MSAEAGSWIRIGDRTKTKDEVDERARRAARGYAELGVGRGDVVAVCMRNDFPFIEASVGAGFVGAYVVPVNWHNTPEEARYVLENSGAKVLVIHADLYRKLSHVVPAGIAVVVAATAPALMRPYKVDAESARVPDGATDWDAWIAGLAPLQPPFETSPGSMIYTSGTTGQPKGVRRQPPTPEQALASQQMMRTLGGLDLWTRPINEVVLLIPGPAYHSSPNGWMFAFYNLGANLVIEPRFDPEGVLRTIQDNRVTHALAVPTMFVRMLALPAQTRAKYDLSSLVFATHVGAPCAPHVKRGMIDWWGPVITEHYGSTEVGAVTFCTSQEWLAHPGTVGRRLDGCQVVIMGEDGRVLEAGEAGEIVCGRDLYPEFTYHGDDGKRQRSGRGRLVATGDVGYFDADGFLHLSGRASDMIIFGGTNIYPAEIEAELMKVPGVADCAVFGIPDEEFGEQVCAFIQPTDGADLDAEAIRADLKQRLASYKLPRRIEFTASLPREDTGKIFKRKLREPFWLGVGRSI
ncbi:acyl-CoA synthetase [Chelatococcus reniformis]|uniref:3-methylmercaptopropionyl-CoA ligase n=1 Tax=Chelatococcus reniformis TaxID=1494448 RepID=A0A916UXT9_9HYPH|nr:acyl-CoA synthetase [Chelatococcus reniformis]GGC92066.1 acyl-CoA synthetase [Chelatococcus reniformis]